MAGTILKERHGVYFIDDEYHVYFNGIGIDVYEREVEADEVMRRLEKASLNGKSKEVESGVVIDVHTLMSMNGKKYYNLSVTGDNNLDRKKAIALKLFIEACMGLSSDVITEIIEKIQVYDEIEILKEIYRARLKWEEQAM